MHTHQKYSLQTSNTQTKTWNEVQGHNVIKQLNSEKAGAVYSSQCLVIILEFS